MSVELKPCLRGFHRWKKAYRWSDFADGRWHIQFVHTISIWLKAPDSSDLRYYDTGRRICQRCRKESQP